MGCPISDPPLPGEGDSALNPYCRKCRRRNNCPYLYGQALSPTAGRENEAAQRLAAGADRLLETVSRAAGVPGLLAGDEALEQELAHALRLELALYDELRDQRAQFGL